MNVRCLAILLPDVFFIRLLIFLTETISSSGSGLPVTA